MTIMTHRPATTVVLDALGLVEVEHTAEGDPQVCVYLPDGDAPVARLAIGAGDPADQRDMAAAVAGAFRQLAEIHADREVRAGGAR
ncbi:hypothetical protein GCM10027294_25320 [Marinactinospora endophytica]